MEYVKTGMLRYNISLRTPKKQDYYFGTYKRPEYCTLHPCLLCDQMLKFNTHNGALSHTTVHRACMRKHRLRKLRQKKKLAMLVTVPVTTPQR